MSKIISDKKGRIVLETLQKVCLVITIIGAIVWGLIGIFDFNLVTFIFGNTFFPFNFECLILKKQKKLFILLIL